ncbi:hypothetical protein SAMN04488691_11076 [Haloferax larsenii]|uniref:Uncharacterized protein n=1 Tax=Haloferax larsenii TaxID=302484 RepID=A0A1H7TVD8_HALLR|nr:hypothetical protein SAMN04488691_11076 [Haloferax larsenii]
MARGSDLLLIELTVEDHLSDCFKLLGVVDNEPTTEYLSQFLNIGRNRRQGLDVDMVFVPAFFEFLLFEILSNTVCRSLIHRSIFLNEDP